MATTKRKKQKMNFDLSEAGPAEERPQKSPEKKDPACAIAAFDSCIDHGMSERDSLAVMHDVMDRMREGSSVKSDRDFFLEDEQDFVYPHGKKKVLMRGNSPVMRDAKEIDTIVLHQTAVEYGVSRRQIKASGGDESLALARRSLDVACHALAFRAGFFAAPHDVRVYVNHGNRFNGRSVGLEIDGRYAGLEDDPSTAAREDLKTTWGGKPTVLSEATINAANRAIVHLIESVAVAGGRITRVVSHRQSSDARRSDPGEAIWKAVAVDFCESELGLDLYLESPWSQGRAVPKAWDKNGKGKY